MKKIITLSLISAGLLIAGPIHDKMDNRLKGKSFGGILDDNAAAEDGLGMMIVQHHSGTTDTNNELIVQKVVSNVVRTETDSTKTIDTLSGILAGTVGSLTDKTLVQTASGNVTTPVSSGFTPNANPQTVVINTPTRHNQAITRTYTFANGWTTPPYEANNTCSGGYQDQMAWGRTTCSFAEGSSALNAEGGLNEGWLNLYTLSDYHTITGLGLKNIDNLKNLQLINNGGLYINGTSIKNVNGLINLEGHSNQNSSTFSGTTWGTYMLATSGTYRGLELKNNPLLENLNGLINFKYTGYLDITGNPSLTDISGLKNLMVVYGSYGVAVDDKNYTVKLPADSWLCQNPTFIKIGSKTGSAATYSNVCN